MASLSLKNLFLSLKQRDWSFFFLLFLALSFVSPSLPCWALGFYGIFFPFFLRMLFRERPSFKAVYFTFPAVCLGLCFLWVGSVSCYGSLFQTSSWRWALDFLCSLVFVSGALWAISQQGENFVEKCALIFAFGGTANEIIALLAYFSGKNIDHYAPDRMPGYGIFHSVVFAGDLSGLVLLSWAVLFYCRLQKAFFLRKTDCFYLILIFFNVLFLYLTGCRMACFALFAALSFLFIRHKSIFLALAGGASLGLFLILKGGNPEFIHHFDSGHFQIWQKTIQQSLPDLWCGKGVQISIKIPEDAGKYFAHPHSFYLSLLLQGGLIGVALFLCCGLSLFQRTQRKAPLGIVFALYAFLCGLTDLSFVFKGPSEEWILFWLPLIMSYASLPPKAESVNIRNRGE